MNVFVITEKQLQYYEELVSDVSLGKIIRSRPLSAELQKERDRVLGIIDKFCFDTIPVDYETEYAYPDRFDAGQRHAYGAVRNKIESLRGEL